MYIYLYLSIVYIIAVVRVYFLITNICVLIPGLFTEDFIFSLTVVRLFF